MTPSSVAVACVLAAGVLFGTSGTAQELGPDATTPLGVGTVRIVLGALTLWIAARRLPGRRLLAHRVPILVGGLGVALYQPMFFEGVARAGVALGTVVAIGSGPFFAGALDWLVRADRPDPTWFVATLVAVAGGTVLVLARSDAGDVDLAGVPFALAAGFGYALYSVTARITIDRGLDATSSLAAPFSVGAVVLVVASFGEPFGWLTDPAGLAMALHLGVLVTGLAYVLYGVGLRRLGAPTTVTLVLVEPVTAALLARFVLDESITATGWLGIAVVLAGLALAGRPRDRVVPAA